MYRKHACSYCSNLSDRGTALCILSSEETQEIFLGYGSETASVSCIWISLLQNWDAILETVKVTRKVSVNE